MAKHEQELTDKVFTAANIITLSRFILIPFFVALLMDGQNIYAFLVFILASITDGLDGLVARATNSCSKLGKILDPIADRVMIVTIAITLFVIGRIPLWVLIIIALRDLIILIGGYVCIKKYNIKIEVIFLGKLATAIMYIGFAGLILAWPWGLGWGLIDVTWLPGISTDYCFYGIYLIYIALILNIFSTGYYIKRAIKQIKEYRSNSVEE